MQADRVAHFHQLLESRRAQLLQRCRNLPPTRATLAGAAEHDPPRGAGRRMNRLVRQLLREQVEYENYLELREVEAALHRIAEHTYGNCASCGKEIAPGRLQLLPHTRVCLSCVGDDGQSDRPLHTRDGGPAKSAGIRRGCTDSPDQALRANRVKPGDS